MQKKTLYKNFISLISFAVLVLFFLVVCAGGALPVPASASSSDNLNFDKTDVLNDLQGITVDGKPFDLADYPAKPSGEIKIIAFAEYCYSQYDNGLGNYALYLYVYNPALEEIAVGSRLNTVELAVAFQGNRNASEYALFSLRYCASSTGQFADRFLKFRVEDTNNSILSAVRQHEAEYGTRPYFVSGVELIVIGESSPHDYPVGRVYTYSGYADGYGDSEKFPLSMSAEAIETLQIDNLHSTYYRYPHTATTSTQIDTVYFSMSPDYVERLGEIFAIRAQYYKYLTSPIVITDEYDFYSYMTDWVGVDIGTEGNADNVYAVYGGGSLSTPFVTSWVYNAASLPWNISVASDAEFLEKMVYLFYTGDGVNILDYVLPSEDLSSYWETYTDKFGEGSGYYGYNNDLFEDGDFSAPSVIDVTSDMLFDLEVDGMVGGRTWGELLWAWLTGKGDVEDVEDVVPIYTVKPEDVADKALISDTLLIADDDVDEFLDFYNTETAAGNNVVLFRFAKSEFSAFSVVIDEHGSAPWNTDSTDVRQEWVYLGFNLISFTFEDDFGVQTVVPVVADPIDVIADVDAGYVPDLGLPLWAKIVLALLALIVLLVILGPIAPYVVKAVIWVVMLPFKAIAAIVKGIKMSVKKKPKSGKSPPKVQPPAVKEVKRK